MTTTFSQQVDIVVAKLGRPDLLSDASSWINATIRELHANEKGKPLVYSKNLNDPSITVDDEDAFSWTPPSNLQILRTVLYLSVFDTDGDPIYPKSLKPGTAQARQDHFYYRSGEDFFFKGQGAVNSLVGLAFYTYLVSLTYFAVGSRPAEFIDGAFKFFDLTASGGIDYDLDDTNRALALTLTTNWMLIDWDDYIEVGARQKGYADTGEETRSRSFFARYRGYRVQLSTAEGAETIDA